jgi:hypothetical protein
LSATIWCVVESVFDQVTTDPAVTVAGFGEYAAVPSVRAFVGIVIVVDALGGAGDGAGAGDGVEGDE